MLPIYIYAALLLLLLQLLISLDRQLDHTVYLLVTSGAALGYVGFLVYTGDSTNILRSVGPYALGELLALGVFVYDAVRRRLGTTGIGGARPSASGGGSTSPEAASKRWGAAAADFTGLAILLFMFSLIISTLGGNNTVTQALGVCTTGKVGCAYLNQPASPLWLSAPNLETWNVTLGLVAVVVALFLVGVAGLLAITAPERGAGATDLGSDSEVSFFQELLRLVRLAFDRVLLSLRLVLSPVVWLIPAMSIAIFSVTVDKHLQPLSPSTTTCNVAQSQNLFSALFSPFGACSAENYRAAAASIILGIVAIGAVIIAVAVAEHNTATLDRTVEVLTLATRGFVLTLVFFIYSLGVLNLVVLRLNANAPKPFRVGSPGIIALAASAVLIVYSAWRDRRAKTVTRQTST